MGRKFILAVCLFTCVQILNIAPLLAADGDPVIEGKTADSVSAGSVDVTGVTDGNIPYMQAAEAGFGDSPLSTDGTTVTSTGNLAITKADPSIVLTPATATDTRYWLGVTEDADGADDDKFQIGDGSTPGTNPFVTVDTSGNVGIGTASPIDDLEVAISSSGAITPSVWSVATFRRDVTADLVGGVSLIGGSGAGGAALLFGDKDDTDIGRVYYDNANNSMDFYTSNTEYMTIDSSGNVGIGTTAPGNKLEVYQDVTAANINTQPLIRMQNSQGAGNFTTLILGGATTNSYVGLKDGSYLGFAIASATPQFVLDTNGNVGINTTGPDRKLDVLDATNPQIRLTHTDGTVYSDLRTDSSGNTAVTNTGGYMTLNSDRVSTASVTNSKAASQAVELTAASSGSSGITVADNDNLDMGTGDFTLVWRGSLPDWTPSATTQLLHKWVSNVGFLFQIDPSNLIKVVNGAYTVLATTTSANTFVDGTVHELAVAVTNKVGAVDGSAVFYIDGILFQSVPITSAYTTFSNAAPLYVCGTSVIRTASRTEAAMTFNYALSAAEVADLYKNGVKYADKWGSQTAVYESDFSADEDGFVAYRATLDDVDGIAAYDDVLRVYASADLGTHWFNLDGTFSTNKRYRIELEYYLPSTNTHVDSVSFQNNDAYEMSTKDSWTSYSFEFIPLSDDFSFYLWGGGSSSYTGSGSDTDDLFYLKNIVITELGPTLALLPENIQTDKWYDATTNNLDASYPAAGASLVRPADDVLPGGQFLLPQENDAATPTLAFGDGNSGFYESSDNEISIAINGSTNLLINNNGIGGGTGDGFLYSAAGNASATTPTLLPSSGDWNTGIGHAAADQLSLIAGGVEGVRISEDTTIAVDVKGSLNVDGANFRNITTVNAATYDLLTTDYILNVTYTATAAVTSLTLPTAQCVAGRIIHIVDAGGLAGTNNITIDTGGSETISGNATKTLNTNYQSVSLYSDGSNWFQFN